MRIVILIGLLSVSLCAQGLESEFRVYTEHPRLFLRPQRLRLLKRERERESMRWRQLDLLISGDAQMPESGFALALYYAIAGNKTAGRHAVEWALGPANDLRQLALVFDWCQDLLSEAQSKALTAKLLRGIQARSTDKSISAQRNRILAAIAVAEQNQAAAESVLRDEIEHWWRGEMTRGFASGRTIDPGSEMYAALEILHAIRDNLTIDLRDSAPSYFKALPQFQVAAAYPAPYAAAENEYRIPLYKGSGHPDLDAAALSRAAGLSTVALDSNALENQYLQGWLLQDRFLMRGPFGAPYEFLWANPYQPGLSYYHLPLVFYESHSGTLLLRSTWEEDAEWFGLYGGEAQLFLNGHVVVLDQKTTAGGSSKPVDIGPNSIVQARPDLRFTLLAESVFIVGGKPRTQYDVEVDDEELREVESDVAGTITLRYPQGREAGVRVKEGQHGGK